MENNQEIEPLVLDGDANADWIKWVDGGSYQREDLAASQKAIDESPPILQS